MRRKGRQTAPHVSPLCRTFQVIHPFHPLYQREFELLSYRKSFGGAFVDYRKEDGSIGSLPLEWTNSEGACPFVELSQGRSLFRIGELLNLVELIEGLKDV